MKNLEKALAREAKKKLPYEPIILNLEKSRDIRALNNLFKKNKIQRVSDDYMEELQELFAVKNPSLVYTPEFPLLFKKYVLDIKKKKPLYKHGRWVFYPWLSTLTHVLEEKDFFLVRTARNKNLITKEEQEKYYNATLGIGGLSVGSSIAYALVLQGGPKHIKLADMDRLALSNTNRILSGVENLGTYKVEMAARFIYQVNPYAKVEIFTEGLTKQNIGRFCHDLDVIIDELDSFPIKYLIREQCRKYKIPLLQAADNGDNGVIDIERYDLNPNMPFFHGRLGKVTYDGFLHLDKFGIGKTITQLVGPENVTEKMRASLLEMGKTIVSWPQLGGAALLNGAAVAYCVRKILNNEPLEGNRALAVMDELLIPGYNSPAQKKKRAKTAAEFKKIFGL